MSGVREYYNSVTGMGHGAKDFSWATILLDRVIDLAAEDR